MTHPLNHKLRFWAVAQSAPDAIVSADEHGNIIFWNVAAERIFGYTTDEIMGKPLTDLMPVEYRKAHSQGMAQYKSNHQAHAIGSILELEGLHKDGTIFPIEISLSSWTGDDGRLYFNGIIRDIAPRKEAENTLRLYAEALQARNQELYAYDRTIAHDLKAPLSVITSYICLLKQIYLADLPPQGLNYLNRIEDTTLRMSEMIDQLLKLAILRDAEAITVPICVNEVVENALSRFENHIEAENIVVEIQPNLPDAVGNATWLEEVFANLIGNAIKYKGKNNHSPKLEICAVSDENLVRYEVRDNGLGIPPEFQSTLFELFTRAHADEGYGFGLGLSIVHRIISRLNGQVGVESEVGKGSTFWFTLPAVSSYA